MKPGWPRVAVVVVPLLLLAAVVAILTRGDGSPIETAAPTTTTTASTRPTSTTSTSSATTSSRSTATTVSTITTPMPAPAGRIVSSIGGQGRDVALTFDAGSDVGHANEILDMLATEHIRAAFGITGRFAERYPDTVARIAAAGHQLVNHSYDHPSFTGFSTSSAALTAAERTDQLHRAETAIVAAAGVGTGGWFRPPYGDVDDGVVRDAAIAGWPTVLMWTVDSLGWQGIGADAVVERCLERAAPGVIYLFHVGQASDDAAALQRIIDGLHAGGYGFAAPVPG